MESAERLHRLASAAADLVQSGMLVGLGTGSTASAVVEELGRRVVAGLTFTGVATSSRTEQQARTLGIHMTHLNDVERLDLGIDGADEIDPEINAIKGRGGALLQEKLVALACDRFVLVASTEKNVERLGERAPLPVEIVSFGWRHTAARLADFGIAPELRRDQARPFVTDNGGYILDCVTGPIEDSLELAAAVKAVAGVVEHGLFLGIASMALQVDPEGVIVRRERRVR